MGSDDKAAAKEAVMAINQKWTTNKNYEVRSPSRIAGGFLYPVTFEGTNDEQYTNYAFRRGDVTKAYHYLDDFIKDSDIVAATFRDPEFVKLAIAGVTSSVLCLGVIAAVFFGYEVGVLAGLFGTAFGYAVGSNTPARRPPAT